MSEDHIIEHCSPTLAGIKTGSIFTCPYTSREALLQSIRQLNRRLSAKGLRVIPLRFSDKKALIYLYRPKKLTADLADTTATALLKQHGYDTDSCQHCVVQLARRLRSGSDFPPRNRSVSGISPGGCLRFYRERGLRLQMRGLLEGLWRRSCRPEKVCPIQKMHPDLPGAMATRKSY